MEWLAWGGDFGAHGILTDVAVDPAFQKKGIGKAMVLYIVQKVQEFVNDRDEFLIELLPTAGNVEFYRRCGFKYAPEIMEGCYKWVKNEKIYDKETKKHALHIANSEFMNIKHKKKGILIKPKDESTKAIKIGDIIMFVNSKNGKTLRTKVISLQNIKSDDLKVKKCDEIKIEIKVV